MYLTDDPDKWTPRPCQWAGGGMPEPGWLLGWRYAVWRVEEAAERAEVDWTDADRAAVARMASYGTRARPPYALVLMHVRGPKLDEVKPDGRLHLLVRAGAYVSWHRVPDRFAVCSCHGDPFPCLADVRDKVAAEAGKLLDKKLAGTAPGMCSGAAFSPDGAYRYLLERIWEPALWPAVFVMLNPSTADASVDDNTIKRCMDFARRWGCGGIVVVNLFAIRATDPKVMLAHPEPVGARNDDVIRAVAQMHAKHWVAAWGVHGTHRGRDIEVAGLLAGEGAGLQCLRLSKQGHPSHPLYLAADLKPKPFTVRTVAGASVKAGGR